MSLTHQKKNGKGGMWTIHKGDMRVLLLLIDEIVAALNPFGDG